MAVDNPEVIDIVSINKAGQVVLTISDHLDWANSLQHQTILQTKFNRYLAFVESGEILEQYPNARGRAVLFNVVFRYRPDRQGEQFLSRARKVIKSAGFKLQYRVFAESYGN